MSRIVYVTFPGEGIAGGLKMSVRHVETLRELGFDAVINHPAARSMPTWFEHHAPVETGARFAPDDILVLPEDATLAIRRAADLRQQIVIFCQNHFRLANWAVESLDAFPPERFPRFITPGATTAAAIRRAYPAARVSVVPCFADERIFRASETRTDTVVCIPRKRSAEAETIRILLPKYHPRWAGLPWVKLEGVSEREVAAAMAASSLFLSLSRYEAVGMSPLEAMASGCVVAGFTGIGGRDFATPENGFWVEEDDVEAAVDALAAAADLVRAGGEPLARYRQAARLTAKAWSFEAFRPALEAFWSEAAPGARPAGAGSAAGANL